MTPGPEQQARAAIDRLLRDADWSASEIGEEENLETGRLDYRLGDLAIIEAKKASEADRAEELKLHLQQAARYARSIEEIPFLMVSDGELHYLKDRRTERVQRVFTMPTRQQLTALKADESVLIEGHIVTPDHLFDFQREAIHEVVGRIVNGEPRALLEMATGTGKTLVAAAIVNLFGKVIRERHNRRPSVLFLVDRDALETQSAERLGAELRDLKVNTIEAIGESRVDVLVAQVATMQHRYNREPFHPGYFDLVVVDEAHRSVHGGVWRQVIEGFDCPQVGLTATPPRLTDDETVAYFGEPVYSYSYERGVREGMLAPVVIHRVITSVDRDGLVADGRHFTSEDFGVRVLIENRDRAIVRYYEDHFYGRKALVFAASTRHAESLWERFNEMFATHGEHSGCQVVVSGAESPTVRRSIVEEFKRPGSDLRVLINLNILTAGFDFPELDLLFMCRYTRHKSLYLQMKGRGARLPLDAGGHLRVDEDGQAIKDRFWMVDFVGVTDWEHRDFEPDVTTDDPAERDVTGDPPDPAEQLVLSVDMEVGIAEVQVTDPFETRENPVLRALRDQLDAVQEDLEAERRARADLEAEVVVARQAERSAHRAAFIQLVTGLRAVSPLTPITEAVLERVAPGAHTLERLNETFGASLDSVQAHIDAVLEAEQ
jgi:type I site-specific restriction endonuclease